MLLETFSVKGLFARIAMVVVAVLGTLCSTAQQDTSAFKKRKLDPVDLNILYGYYDQNGYHSAVTGGVGSEKLDVHSTTIALVIPLDTNVNLNLEAGIDIVTSASTDKIDFVMSSASILDGHHHAKLGFDHRIGQWKYGLTYSYAMESDYFSNGARIDLSRTSKDRNTTVGFSAQFYYDYVTWGWHQFEGNVKPIIPAELRFQNTDYGLVDNRLSYNFNLSATRNLTKRLNAGLFFSPSYQSGQLATPFHRVYLQDKDQAVIETLPNARLKLPIGLRANYFAFDLFILRWMYRFYWDDWGVLSHMTGLEVPIKLSAFFTVSPVYRFYNQTAASYFAGYRRHTTNSEFFSSDYDLSAFSSHKFGLGVKLAPARGLLRLNKRGYMLRSLALHYAYYLRTDGLDMHIFGTVISFGG